jgi:hypothetical protein
VCPLVKTKRDIPLHFGQTLRRKVLGRHVYASIRTSVFARILADDLKNLLMLVLLKLLKKRQELLG